MSAPGGKRTLAALFKEAAGDRDSLEIEGRKVEFDPESGMILVDRQYLDDLGVDEIQDVAAGLKEAAAGKFLDPNSSPLKD